MPVICPSSSSDLTRRSWLVSTRKISSRAFFSAEQMMSLPPSALGHGRSTLRSAMDNRNSPTASDSSIGLDSQHGARHRTTQGVILLEKCAQRLACVGSRHGRRAG